jgi:ribonuclease HI
VNVDEAMRFNTYLQSWAPYQSAKDLGSKDLADMMKTGLKYGITMDAMAVSRKLQDDMPIWYHRFSGGDRSLFNAKPHIVSCLKDKHRIRWVRDTRILARKIAAPNHRNALDCSCATCQMSREITGCQHPNECYIKAQELLNSLENKWDPRVVQPEDYEEYQTPSEGDDPNVAEFDARITTDGTLADTFRIFTRGYMNNTHTAPDTRFAPNQGLEVEVYTDGSAIDNNTGNVKAGAGIFFGADDPRNKAIRIPDELGPSNQVGEVVAIREAVEIAPIIEPLRIYTDSKYAKDGFTKNLQK